jgi:2-oxo-3-hexenedioate decarboxylase
MTVVPAVIHAHARAVLEAWVEGARLTPFTARDPSFDLATAYHVAAEVNRMRAAAGAFQVGWKIGFTNRTIWDEYGVHAPIWGPMWSTTVIEVDPAVGPLPIPVSQLAEPRIEPEICLRFAHAPEPGMDERALFECLDGIGHGFEIVHSLYPDWAFKAADTVAAFALHGLYRHGPLRPPAPEDFAALTRFSITLSKDGVAIDEGQAGNVLGGPLSALRHMLDRLSGDPAGRQIKAGDLVTTGTVTRAFPVKPGEVWSTAVEGLDVPNLSVAIVG